jgi:ParB-like chromosome segregation protein Spo0J
MPQPDGTLVKAPARVWRWQRMLDRGIYTTVSEIGDAENISKSYVSRILRVALLAHDIVEAILAARRIRRRCWSSWSSRCRVWEEQRRVLGVGSASDGG